MGGQLVRTRQLAVVQETTEGTFEYGATTVCNATGNTAPVSSITVASSAGFEVGATFIVARGDADQEQFVVTSIPDGTHIGIAPRVTVFDHNDATDTVEMLAFASTTVPIPVYEFSFDPQVSQFERRPYKESLSALQPLTGMRSGRFTFKVEVRGVVDIATDTPEPDLLLKACGMSRADTGTDKTYTPISDVGAVNVPALSMEVRDGTVSILLKGARGTFKLAAVNGEVAFYEFDFTGAIEGVVDNANSFTGSPNAVVPPVFLDAAAQIHGHAAIFRSCDFDMGNEVQMRESANDATGILSYMITGRNAGGNMDPEMEAVSTEPFYDDLFNAAAGNFTFRCGSSTHNTITVTCPQVTYRSISDEERSSIATVGVAFSAHESAIDAEDEVSIEYS